MKFLLIAALVAVAAARPQEEFAAPDFEQDSGILRMDINGPTEDGSFQYGYETTDPAAQDVTGEQRQIGDGAGTVMQGSYSFTTPEGQDVTINWVADENGFQATGDAIPVDANSVDAAF